jgi:hypothetical protein
MWVDRLGNRRHDDEDYDSVENDIKRRHRPKPDMCIYCSKCSLPIPARLGITKHKICPETTSNQDGR